MPNPSPEIITLVSVFATAFTAPTFAKALILLYGTILAPGRQTVTAALRAMGLTEDKQFAKYSFALNHSEFLLKFLDRIGPSDRLGCLVLAPYKSQDGFRQVFQALKVIGLQ